jgi:predicted O-methyltransferase YrrM
MNNIDIELDLIKDKQLFQLNYTPEYDIQSVFYAFLKCKKIENILEIGTNLGYTTKNIALNYPNSKVYTIDIYRELGIVQQDNPCLNEIPSKSDVGKEAHNINNVTQLYGNSNDYDFGNTIFDAIFIDGNHSYEGVSKDFHNLLSYIKDGTIISFHDVNDNPIVEGVTRFLNELEQKGITVNKVNNSNVAFIIFKNIYFKQINEVITMNEYVKLSGIPPYDVEYLVKKAKEQQDIGAFIELGAYRCGVSLSIASETSQNVYAFDHFRDFKPIEHKRVKAITGDIFNTLEENIQEDRYGMIFFDLDEYDITKHCIEYFFANKHILKKGCLFIFHDYNWHACPGINKVVDELMKTNEDFVFVETHNYFITFQFEPKAEPKNNTESPEIAKKKNKNPFKSVKPNPTPELIPENNVEVMEETVEDEEENPKEE